MPTTKYCSKCKQPFGCSNDVRGCWCEGLTLSMETLKELKDNFDNCLCPACLAAFETKQKLPVTKPVHKL